MGPGTHADIPSRDRRTSSIDIAELHAAKGSRPRH